MKWLLAALFFLTNLYGAAVADSLNLGCRCPDITPERMWNADAWLWLSTQDKRHSIETHLPWGQPLNPSGADREKLLVQRHYIINHDGDLRTATWTSHRLRRGDINVTRDRTECFRRDERLWKSHAAYCSDYQEPTYDQGHLVPNSDMKRSLRAMLNTYIMSNMAPQHCAFNRGTWLILESLVRHWVSELGTIYVITGSVFDRDGTPGRDADSRTLRMTSDNGESRVAIPSHFYKILSRRLSNGDIDTLSILLPHVSDRIGQSDASQRAYLTDNIVSIDEIETRTGIDFFPDLDAAVETAVESAQPIALWAIPTNWPGRLDYNCP